MITSRITSKAQTTIPQAVRKALKLRQGDEIAYAIESGRVTISKARAKAHGNDPFATFEDGPARSFDYPNLEDGYDRDKSRRANW